MDIEIKDIKIKKSDRYQKSRDKLLEEISDLHEELDAKLDAKIEEIKKDIISLYEIKLKPEGNKLEKFFKKCKFEYYRKYKTLNGKYFEREIFLGDEKIGIISYFDEKEKVLNFVDLIRYKKSDKKNKFNLISNILFHPMMALLLLSCFICSQKNLSFYSIEQSFSFCIFLFCIFLFVFDKKNIKEYKLESDVIGHINYLIYSPKGMNWWKFLRMLCWAGYIFLVQKNIDSNNIELIIICKLIIILILFILLFIEMLNILNSPYLILSILAVIVLASVLSDVTLHANLFILSLIILLVSEDVWKLIKDRNPISKEYLTEKNNAEVNKNVFKIKIVIMGLFVILYIMFFIFKKINVAEYSLKFISHICNKNLKDYGIEWVAKGFINVLVAYIVLLFMIFLNNNNKFFKFFVDPLLNVIYSKVYKGINFNETLIPEIVKELSIDTKFVDKIDPKILIKNREEIPENIQVFFERVSIKNTRKLLIIYPNRRIYECKYKVEKNKIILKEEIKLINE